MKRILSIILISITTCVGTSVAQHSKLGHVDAEKLIFMLPETKVADSTMQKFKASLDSQYKVMMTELQTKYSEYKASEANMAEPVKQSKAKELEDLESRIVRFQEDAEASVQKKQQELLAPITSKVEEAIKAVAKEKGYAYIFNMSQGVILYAQESDDVTPLIKTKLGLK